MRVLLAVVLLAATCIGAGAQPRFAVQEPEPEGSATEARSRHLDRASDALLFAGVGLLVLESTHQRESCQHLNAQLDCVRSKRGIWTWGAVGALSASATLTLWKILGGDDERHAIDVGVGRVEYRYGW